MRTDRAVRRVSSDRSGPIVNRMTPVKTLPSLAVGKNNGGWSTRTDFTFLGLRLTQYLDPLLFTTLF